jgi:membrane associated rhomboid family serine protease
MRDDSSRPSRPARERSRPTRTPADARALLAATLLALAPAFAVWAATYPVLAGAALAGAAASLALGATLGRVVRARLYRAVPLVDPETA